MTRKDPNLCKLQLSQHFTRFSANTASARFTAHAARSKEGRNGDAAWSAEEANVTRPAEVVAGSEEGGAWANIGIQQCLYPSFKLRLQLLWLLWRAIRSQNRYFYRNLQVPLECRPALNINVGNLNRNSYLIKAISSPITTTSVSGATISNSSNSQCCSMRVDTSPLRQPFIFNSLARPGKFERGSLGLIPMVANIRK
ncbi:hypothetical protein CPB84DRAFT_1755871 [Gymnopilus junonius]|uniref:Uncharacterized protein n=1 Tax=Gymnopilus junonius TaxID=109634 RepID=A0A9P5TF13_GYMJU|nr:hypothetical protein CPB84DRAFT_1755871 [Gymnopilus junonius]